MLMLIASAAVEEEAEEVEGGENLGQSERLKFECPCERRERC